MGKVSINGQLYENVNSFVVTNNNNVIINGKSVNIPNATPQINVTVEGDVEIGKMDVNTLTVNGSVTTKSNIDCNTFNVSGDVTCGDVDCNTITVKKNLTCRDVDANTVSAGNLKTR